MSFSSRAQFDSEDLEQMASLGISPSQVEAQLERIQQGFSPVKLDRPATTGDGILSFPLEKLEEFARVYEREVVLPGRAMKFVPASGAASRMFRDLVVLRKSLAEGAGSEISEAGARFFRRLRDFPFYRVLKSLFELRGDSLEGLLKQKEYLSILDALLGPAGLGYETAPKALIPFYCEEGEVRTALEQQCSEAEDYIRDSHGVCRLHFTVPEERLREIESLTRVFLQSLPDRSSRYDVGFSVQSPATHSIAVDEASRPLRRDDGRLVFRPAGHGALLQNLEYLRGDVVFIKNIDNVVSSRERPLHAFYKKALGGILAAAQKVIFDAWLLLKRGELSLLELDRILRELSLYFPELSNLQRGDVEAKRAHLIRRLDRPLRVCGMVRNTGKPGGGPFWVAAKDGTVSLQIVEEAEVNSADPSQKRIFQKASHFNPVDLVCGLRGADGQAFSLRDYVDVERGLVVEKSEGARTLKCLELPGLWNGSMAYWNSIFVEVPEETFNPAKTFWDLLRDSEG